MTVNAGAPRRSFAELKELAEELLPERVAARSGEAAAPLAGQSALARRFLERLGHRRKQVFEDRARAEMNLGRDLHAGREAVALAVRFKVLVLEADQRLEGERLRTSLLRLGGRVRAR